MGKEKGYNSRFTSNTETVSRVACYLYIKATRKLAAALAYGIHRSIYRLFLSFPHHSRRISYFPSSSSSFPSPLPPSCLFYSRYALYTRSFSPDRPPSFPPLSVVPLVFSPLPRLSLLALASPTHSPVADT